MLVLRLVTEVKQGISYRGTRTLVISRHYPSTITSLSSTMPSLPPSLPFNAAVTTLQRCRHYPSTLPSLPFNAAVTTLNAAVTTPPQRCRHYPQRTILALSAETLAQPSLRVSPVRNTAAWACIVRWSSRRRSATGIAPDAMRSWGVVVTA